MLDLHRLRILRELHLRGTLAAVASAMSYVPSTISQQLAQLEEEAGVPLLEHVGRNVRLTRAAEQLVAHTERMLEIVEIAERDLAASRATVSGRVTLATFQTVAVTIVPRAVMLLAERHPALVVEVVHLEPHLALPALLARDLDLVIAAEFPGQPLPRSAQFDHEFLFADPIELALPPGHRTRQPLHLLADHPWVMEEVGSPARQWADSTCRGAGFEPIVRYTSPDLLVHIALVEAGLAVALLPRLATTARPSTIVRSKLSSGQVERRILTVARQGAGDHPTSRAVRNALRDASFAPKRRT